MKIIEGQFCRNDEKDDTLNDWLYSALCFAGALSCLLKRLLFGVQKNK